MSSSKQVTEPQTAPHVANSTGSNIRYVKRKNTSLFKTFDKCNVTQAQNYLPLYENFFKLNDKNYNSINIQLNKYVKEIVSHRENNVYSCIIEESDTEDSEQHSLTATKNVFFKFAPLIDPLKYLVGKYPVFESIELPKINGYSAERDAGDKIKTKLYNKNNSSYIDGFFSYISSQLYYKYKFPHSVLFYGCYLGVKNEFQYNIIDDLSYLGESDFFKKHRDKHFKIENGDDIVFDYSKNPIQIHDSQDVTLQVDELDSNIFSDIFDNQSPTDVTITTSESDTTLGSSDSIIQSHEEMETVTVSPLDTTNETIHLHSTENEDDEDTDPYDSDEDASDSDDSTTSEPLAQDACHQNDGNNYFVDNKDSYKRSESQDTTNTHLVTAEDARCPNGHGIYFVGNRVTDAQDDGDDNYEDMTDSDEDSNSDTEDSEGDSEGEEDVLNAIINKMPVNIICLEECQSTLDNLITGQDLSDAEWLSALMQIIMTLITYQKLFSFVHNDLHTNNIMYNKTEERFIYYKYADKLYKVPTFGRIYKIIDFGRGTYKWNGNIFFSDSFAKGEDAYTQYNTEPYFNSNKPRVEPNFSFDICRLGCSIYDYLINDIKNAKKICKSNPIANIINEWCSDDNGVNVLYKNNGDERYPDFKLYKMITKSVHDHTPINQLKRKEFSQFVVSKIKKGNPIVDIDAMV